MLAFPEAKKLEFPDCRPVRIPRNRIAGDEGRFEHWDADSEVAMMVRELTTTWHEHPSQRLSDLATLISRRGFHRLRPSVRRILQCSGRRAIRGAFCRRISPCACDHWRTRRAESLRSGRTGFAPGIHGGRIWTPGVASSQGNTGTRCAGNLLRLSKCGLRLP